MNERVKSTLEKFLEPGEVLHHWVFGQSFKAGLITLYAVVSLFVAAFSAQILFGSAGFGRTIVFWIIFAVILTPLATSVTTIFLFGLTDRRLIVAHHIEMRVERGRLIHFGKRETHCVGQRRQVGRSDLMILVLDQMQVLDQLIPRPRAITQQRR